LLRESNNSGNVTEVPEKAGTRPNAAVPPAAIGWNSLPGGFRVSSFCTCRQKSSDRRHRLVNARLDPASRRSNRNPSNHSERSAISICARSGGPGPSAADRAPSPDGEESSAVAGWSQGGCGLHLTMVRTTQESRNRARSSVPVSRRVVMWCGGWRRPEARAAAPRGAPSHPADDSWRWSQ